MQKNKGFSVIELLMGLLVFSVLVVLAVSFGRSATQRSAFTAGVNKFIADFSFARQLASMENRYVAIDFNVNGQSYIIKKQTSIGNLANWTYVKTVDPMEGKELFDGAVAQDFAFNSLGEVFSLPLNVNSVPTQLTMTLFIKNLGTGIEDYSRTVRIFPSGGIKIE